MVRKHTYNLNLLFSYLQTEQNNKESNNTPLESSDIMNDDIKKRMNELENQLKIQNENLNKMSSLANKKEEKLNNDISQYLKQINDLKNELELLNSTITNLTEEKENNTIKLTELIHENEQLKKNQNSIINNNNNNNNNMNNNNENQNKKYEDLIMKLKKNIVKLNDEKKSLEEVIIKQEEKVNELSIKVDNVKKEIVQKDKELKESIEYNAKLTSTINLHKKEIQKLKQSATNISSNSTNLNANKNKEVMNIMNLQKEIQNIKKEIETKDNKINLLSMNNKILQGKVNKLSQTTKNGFNNEQNNINNKNVKLSLINPKINDNKTFHKDKNKVFIVAKPKQSQNIPSIVSGRQNSTSIRVKNDFYKNNEDNMSNNNNDFANKSKYSNLQQIKKPQKRNNSNINNIKRQNDINNNNLNNININNININKSNYINNNNKSVQRNKAIDMKYKEIESKYKKEINKEMKDETLFDDDVINNFDIKEEIVVGNNIEPIEVVSNMVSQTLKPKKNKQYNLNEQSLNMSQEKDFQIIESYCFLPGQKDEVNNDENTQGNYNKDNTIKEDDSKMENNQVEELHNHVKKILDEF